jgi:Replication-relaxation
MNSLDTHPPHDAGRPVGRPIESSGDMRPGRSGDESEAPSGGNSLPTRGAHSRPGRRLGSRSLRTVLESLSDRDVAVLRSVAAHRFISTRQLERLHFADHATPDSGARASRRVLNRLHVLHLLVHLERRVGGVRAGSAGYVWHLASAGQRVIAMHDGTDPGRQREPSERLLKHSLAVAETHVVLVEAARSGRFELIDVQLEPASWRRFHGLGGEVRLIRPDLSAVTAVDDYEDHWFIEVDLGSEHPPTVVRKCGLYLDYQASGTEQRRLGIFPRVVWIVRDQARGARIRHRFDKAKLSPELFRVTRREELADVVARGGA